MRNETPDGACVRALADELGNLGFTLAQPASVGPVASPLRAVRGHCEVHLSVSGDSVFLGIPVVRLGPDRPLTGQVSQYLDDRNAAPKGPGTFSIEGDVIWYRAVARSDPSTTAATALSMQETVEKIGPKILNLLR